MSPLKPELRDFCRTSNLNELAIKNEELRLENVYLQGRLASLGLKIEDLKKQDPSAGEKTKQRMRAGPKKAKKGARQADAKGDGRLDQLKKDHQKETAKIRAELKRLTGENRVMAKLRDKLEKELDGVRDKLESEKEKTIWLNQENLRLQDQNQERDQERERVKELKGRGAEDVNRLQREVKMANFMRDQEIKRMERLRKGLDLQLKDHFYDLEPAQAQAGESQEEQIQALLAKLEKVRKKYQANLERVYEAERTARNAEMLKVKAEKLKIANDREIVQMKKLVEELEEYKEKGLKYDALKAEVDDLKEIKNQFDVFKREAENFVRVTEQKIKFEKDLKATRLELEKTRLKLANAEETIREKNFELGNFEVVKAGIQTKADTKVEQYKELCDRAERKAEQLYDEVGQIATEKIFLEVLQANADQKKQNLQEIIRDLQSDKQLLEKMAEEQRQRLFDNERVRLERDMMQKKLARVEAELSEVKEANHRKERQLGELFNKYGDFGGLKDQIADLKDKLKERDGQIMDMVFEINTRAREIDLENEEIDSLSGQLRQARQRVRDMERALEQKRRAGREDGVMVDEAVLDELEKAKRDLKSGELRLRNKEVEVAELRAEVESLKSGKDDFVPLRDLLLAKSETEQHKADMERQKERVAKVLRDKKMLEELIEYNDQKVKQLHVDLSEAREDFARQLVENKEVSRGLRSALKRQQELGLEVEELRDVVEYKDQLIRAEKKSQQRLEYVTEEAKKEARDARERTRRAEERLPELEDRLVEMESERIDMEENQIFVINNFLERIQSKDTEIQRKIDNLGYKEGIIKRLTADKTLLTDKVKMYEKLIREIPEIEGGGNLSVLHGSKGTSQIGGASRLRSKIRKGDSASESKMGFISGGAILEDIDMVAREKEMNRKLKEQVKMLNDRVKELELSLEGGTRMLTENAARLQQEMKGLEMERQRLLLVEKEKVLQDGLVAKMEALLKQFATEKLAAEEALKRAQEAHKKDVAEMNREVEDISRQLETMIGLNAEQLGTRDKTMENLVHKLRNKEREREELQEDNERLERALSKMTNEREFTAKELKKARDQIKEHEKTLRKNEERIQDILEETDMRGAHIKQQDRRIEAMELERDTRQQKEKELRDKHAEVTRGLDQETLRVKEELRRTAEDRDRLQEQRDRFMRENEDRESDIRGLKERTRQLEGDIDEYNGKVDEYVEFLENKKQITEDKLATKMAEVDQLRTELATKAQGDAAELRKQNNDLSRKIERADVVVDRMWDKVKGLREENQDLRKVVDRMRADPQMGTAEFRRLNDDFNQIKMNMDNYVRAKEKERALLKEEKDKAVKEKYQLTEQLGELRKENTLVWNKLSLAEIKIFALVSRMRQAQSAV